MEKKITIAFVIMMTIILSISIYSWLNMQKFYNISLQMQETNNKLKLLEENISKAQDLKTNIHGYISTGNLTYLSRYQASIREIASLSNEIFFLLSKDTASKKNLVALKITFSEFLQFHHHLYSAYKSEGQDSAGKIMGTLKGRELLDRLKNRIYNMEEKERALLRNLQKDQQQKALTSQNLLILFSVISILMLFLGYKVIKKDIEGKRNSEIELKKFRKALDTSADDIFIIDRETMKFTDVNNTACISTEYSRDELLQMGPADLAPYMMDRELVAKFDAIGNAPDSFGILQTTHLSKNGKEKEMEIFLRSYNLSGKRNIVASARDITERKLIEDLTKNLNKELEHRVNEKTTELEKTNKLLNSVFERITDGCMALDKNWNLTFVNSAAAVILGKSADKLLSKNILQEFSDRSPDDEFYLVCQQAMSDQVSASVEGYYKPLNKWFDNRIYPSPDGVTIYFRDITEKKLTDQNLKEYSEQLQQLNARLQHIREEERTNISREIHDELGQQLTGLKMDVSWLSKKLGMEDGVLKNKTSEMLHLIDELIRTVKRISTELRPGVLDDLGLEAALEWHAGDFEKRTGIKCEFHSLLKEKKFSRDFSTAVFRIFQETLTNVARHSHATEVKAFADETDQNLMLIISDNGVGMSEKEMHNVGSLGILGMNERAKLLGGRISIEGMKGKGTTVTLEMPLLKMS